MFRRRETGQVEAGAAGSPAPAGGPLLPYYPPKGYLGQLEPSHQEDLARRRAGADLTDFTWYHATELPDGTVLPGVWDLAVTRSSTSAALTWRGRARLRARPGHRVPDLLDGTAGCRGGLLRGRLRRADRHPAGEGAGRPRRAPRVMQQTIDPNHDGWWHLHRTFGSAAKFVQGNIYDMPADLGTFDVTLVGAILSASARALGRPFPGGPADHRRHDRHRAAAGRHRPAGVQHHALLALGRAPPDQLVVDLSRCGRLRCSAGSVSAIPRSRTTRSVTICRTTWGATPSTSPCTPSWGGGSPSEPEPERD